MQATKTHPVHQPVRFRLPGDAHDLVQAGAGLAIAALVTIGFGGTVYYLLAPGGWFAQIFGRSLAGGIAVLLALLMIGVSAWLLRAWISVTQRDRYAELFVYVFAGIGLVYSVDLLMRGSL